MKEGIRRRNQNIKQPLILADMQRTIDPTDGAKLRPTTGGELPVANVTTRIKGISIAVFVTKNVTLANLRL